MGTNHTKVNGRKRRKICVVTGSRADYGIQYSLLKEIQNDSRLELQVLVTGMHLSPQFGMTYKLIEKDGFPISAKVNILKYADTEQGVIKSIGLGCQIFSHTLEDLKPDIVVLIGDRFEMLSVAIAAYIAKIPTAHIHGGEVTEGVFDEGIRHSITKMASVHFPATDDYKRRIIQMGEDPKLVYNFGAPALDVLYKARYLNREELSKRLNFRLGKNVAIVTFHPVTLEKSNPKRQIENLLDAIKSFPFQVIFTKANADPYGSIINNTLEAFCKKHPNKYRLYDNLGPLYYSCLRHCILMIGNSSSGIVEAPSFSLPVVNIGDRQKHRVKAPNIIDVGSTTQEIKKGICLAISKKFSKGNKKINNPYDLFKDGKSSYRIKEKLKNLKVDEKLIKKSFYDLPMNGQFSHN